MNVDLLTHIAALAEALLTIVITVVGIPAVAKWGAKLHLDAIGAEATQLRDDATQIIYKLEQDKKNGVVSVDPATVKNAAITWLQEKYPDLPIQALDDAIEAAVGEMNALKSTGITVPVYRKSSPTVTDTPTSSSLPMANGGN